VQVGTADRGRGDAHDRVGRLLDLRVWDLIDPDVAFAVESERFHRSSSAAEPGSAISARSKNSVSVAPGISEVTAMPVSFNSLRIANAKDCTKDFEAL
jgi:hypothetical protein